ncbi:NADH:ubiquinone oxidoreductase 24 kD subunit (chain E) (NuoE) (PDB:5XF9) [Commensalibacter communis]|uniref:complex I 24 kDa subunit family protein n=1 Tax=Commensalibacter communis TaxID=2972786 RepID=UPI0022FF98C0|nr:NAD(P)H-dependent oxidoreductase subunit E [Commensalibacter communis]CAI3933217.1 NADH:ubiquinone oxidoreductase 24 kD subunit (chain E) (NuoE) (PDB:5XF9) [Commensalibacter communis]
MSEKSMNIQPAEFTFDQESEQQIEKILTKYPAARKASAVISLLYVVQNQMNRQTKSAWVPKVAMSVVAKRLEISPVRVYEVATFYTMFNLEPIGQYHLQVCGTTPCWLRGSDDIVTACKNATGIKEFGQTSNDGMFTLSEVECLGACANAPILQVDHDYYEDMTAESTTKLIDLLRQGNKPAHGSMIDRFNSAPIGKKFSQNTEAKDVK